MYKPKTFAFAMAVAAIALTALVGTASATTLTSPAGTAYTSTIKAANEGGIELHGVEKLTCKNSALETKVEQHGSSVTVKGNVSTLTFLECNHDVEVITKGRLEIHSTTNGNGTVTWSGGLITVEFTTEEGSVHCVYGGNNIDLSTLTAAATGSGHAVLDLGTALLPVAGGDEACGKSGELTGKYKVTTPTGLQVERPPPTGTIVTSPSGTTFTSTIKAENSSAVTLHGFVDLTCQNSTFEGKVESHGHSVTAKGSISSLTFSNCNHDWVVLKPGTFEIHADWNGGGTLTSSGAEVTVTVTTVFGSTHCLFGTSNTSLGTLTGASSSTGHATLAIWANINTLATDFACGFSPAAGTGGYKFTSPTGLTIDGL